MILRRLTQHLRVQNWAAVMLELIIISVGVLIGIQAANWNEARQEHDLERRLLGYLVHDLRGDLIKIDNTRASASLRISAMDAVITEVTGEPLPTEVFFPVGFLTIKKTPPYAQENPYAINPAIVISGLFNPNRSAFETLVNTGAIELIRNERLALQIQQYYTHADQRGRFEGRMVNMRDKVVEAQLASGFSYVDHLTLLEVADKVRASPALRSAIKTFWSFSVSHRYLLDQSYEEAEALISEIEKELQ